MHATAVENYFIQMFSSFNFSSKTWGQVAQKNPTFW